MQFNELNAKKEEMENKCQEFNQKQYKVKEYYKNGELKFEGEYLNDNIYNGKFHDYKSKKIIELKNGKGSIKEYNDYGRLIFEGEYLIGERNGKGKEYYNGKLEFEGGYLNGLRNGKGKEYDWVNGNLIFEGKYLHGIRNDKGK